MKFNESKFNLHWQDKRLSELGDFQRGKSRHRPRNDPALFAGGTYPLIQTGEIKAANLYISENSVMYNDFGLAQSKLWPKNTLCITIAANIAETALLEYPMCFPDSVVGFNAYPDESSELFMHYVFTYIRRAIQNSATGSIQDNINVEYLTNLEFKIPSKKYQDKIVGALSALDQKIDCNNRINAEMESMAKLLYDYWFVQFNFPNEKGLPYMSSGGAMVFNEVLKRHIPVGWDDSTIGAVEPNIVTGKTPSKNHPEFFNGDIPFITIGDIRGNAFIVSTEESLSILGAESQKSKFLPADAICVSCIASPGLVGFVMTPSQTNQQINSIICANDANRYYLYFALKSYFEGSKAKTGNTFANMNKGDFCSIKILSPANECLESFHKIVSPIFNQIKIRLLENMELNRLRDWLLPMLMNGQVTIS